MTTTTAAEAEAKKRRPLATDERRRIEVPARRQQNDKDGCGSGGGGNRSPPQSEAKEGWGRGSAWQRIHSPAIVTITVPRDMATVVLAIEASPSRRGVSVVGSVAGGGRRDKGQQGGEGLTNGRRGRGE